MLETFEKGAQKTRKNISHWGAISSFSPLHLSLCTLVDTIQRQPHPKRKQTLILGSSTGVLVGIDVHKYISTAWAVFGIPFNTYQISPYTLEIYNRNSKWVIWKG